MLNLISVVLAGSLSLFPANVPAETQISGPEVAEILPQIEKPTPTGGRYVTVTAYTSEPRQTDSTPCIASDGSDICQRYAKGELICAAGDRNVPLGSKFYVEGYGTCTVADRMNIRYNGTGRVDIYLGYDTPSAFNWGRRTVRVSSL